MMGTPLRKDKQAEELTTADLAQGPGPAKTEELGPKPVASERSAKEQAGLKAQAEESACASKILSRMAHLAYRRPATERDTRTLLQFFQNGREEGGSFDA